MKKKIEITANLYLLPNDQLPVPGFIQTLAIEDFLFPVEYALPNESIFFSLLYA